MKKNIGKDWKPKLKCITGRICWVMMRLNPLIIEERIPYQPRLLGPILLCAEPIINSSNNIK